MAVKIATLSPFTTSIPDTAQPLHIVNFKVEVIYKGRVCPANVDVEVNRAFAHSMCMAENK